MNYLFKNQFPTRTSMLLPPARKIVNRHPDRQKIFVFVEESRDRIWWACIRSYSLGGHIPNPTFRSIPQWCNGWHSKIRPLLHRNGSRSIWLSRRILLDLPTPSPAIIILLLFRRYVDDKTRCSYYNNLFCLSVNILLTQGDEFIHSWQILNVSCSELQTLRTPSDTNFLRIVCPPT